MHPDATFPCKIVRILPDHCLRNRPTAPSHHSIITKSGAGGDDLSIVLDTLYMILFESATPFCINRSQTPPGTRDVAPESCFGPNPTQITVLSPLKAIPPN